MLILAIGARKDMNIFYECPGMQLGIQRADAVAHLVAREHSLNDFDERTVAGHEVNRLAPGLFRECEIEADEGLARTGDAGDEAGDMALINSGFFHNPLNESC